MALPKKEEFLEHAKTANLIPIYEEYSASLETPLGAFLKLKQGCYAFFLESVERGVQMGRYSFIGVEPSLIFQAKNGQIIITENGQKTELTSSDPLKELEKIFRSFKPMKVPGLPGFSGGAVGYLGYEMIRYWEDLPKKAKLDTDYPDCLFMFTDTLVIFDHVRQSMKIVVNVSVGGEPEKDYLQAKVKIKKIYARLNNRHPEISTIKQNLIKKDTFYRSNCTSNQFEEMVEKAQSYIRAGDIFQVVLSRKIQFELRTDPVNIYRSLRFLNPSPYMFYLAFDDIHLIGSSPEVMVKVEEGVAQLCPIAGTRPRGKTEKEDKRLAEELLNDEKERAEHLMLVDLGRNDLGRVCRYGSVQVQDFMSLENYSHVMHIVSRVSGELQAGYSCFDLIRASFPAGTVSGAPKIRAMEIIDRLEPDGRGPYGGAVGWISYTGNMDTCITIRTLIIKGNRAFIQAGAGIVADSQPEREYQEVSHKAEAILKAVEMAERGGKFAVGN
ncbi:MAG: anthranilate synthase [Clostridiaceae bacterium BRH_c20a]|nr:MAG: anthranilate synthase [Clostridiaceae bacterium BRH_c20a]